MRYKWAGGEGADDRIITLGYCKELKKEVLKRLIKNYVINSYCASSCRPIDEYPSNIDGLLLYDIDDKSMKGVNIVGSIDDYIDTLDFKELKWDKFSIEKFKLKIEELSEYAEHFDDTNFCKQVYRDIVKEFKEIYDELK